MNNGFWNVPLVCHMNYQSLLANSSGEGFFPAQLWQIHLRTEFRHCKYSQSSTPDRLVGCNDHTFAIDLHMQMEYSTSCRRNIQSNRKVFHRQSILVFLLSRKFFWNSHNMLTSSPCILQMSILFDNNGRKSISLSTQVAFFWIIVARKNYGWWENK